METVSIKLEEEFLQDVEQAMEEYNYTTKTEFIREALRDKLKDLQKQKYLLQAIKLYGAGKEKHRAVTDERIHEAREKAARELAKELGVDLE